MTALHGRVMKLEAALKPSIGPETCRSCGLRHVRPLTLALVRGALRVEGGSEHQPDVAPQPLCLCDPCCGEPGDRWLARLSHGLPLDEHAA
jgi:hypothetical protein